MAVLPIPAVNHRYEERSLEAARARARMRTRLQCGIALMVYSTTYPLLAFALWTGARDGAWAKASVFVALGVLMSFVGWGMLSSIGEPNERSTNGASGHAAFDVTVFLALYNRAGAIVILLESYSVAASSQGWPTPHTFNGWFALVWIPLLIAFCIPIKRSTVRDASKD
jgi:hypothetical protein